MLKNICICILTFCLALLVCIDISEYHSKSSSAQQQFQEPAKAPVSSAAGKPASPDPVDQSVEGAVPEISMVRLIADPQKYDGEVISINGYCSFKFEGTAVYLHEEDFWYGNMKNAVWLNLNANQSAEFRKYNRHYINFVGKFSSTERGHKNAFIGSMDAQLVGVTPRQQ